ncbi:probable ubiquitin-like-specific protease 2B [Setaria italica]|nr:probable ubiquitin-like-specific protease 2B [Setaria italica]
MALYRSRLEIDWDEVFSPYCPDRDGNNVDCESPSDVRFEYPSSAPHAGAAAERPRAGPTARASSDDDKRRGTPSSNQRFPGMRSDPGRRVGGRSRSALVDVGARRPLTRAAAKAARQGLDARSATRDVFSFNKVDEDGEDVGRKYCLKSSPDLDRKNKYGQLPMIKRQSQRTISVDKMYKRQPCSTPVSGNLQRVHAIDPDESDNGKCQQSENSSFSRFTKRRKEQLQASSSVYSRKVQDVVLLDDEDMQTEGEVNCEMSGRRNEPKIYYPSRDDPEAVELTGSDINCLDPGAFLSSPVINYYIQNIKRNILCSDDCRDKFYIFNTYFYGKLEEALYRRGDFSKLRRWWKGVNIFHRAYIILPIHGMAHWSLVIICMPAKESISGPIILHLDSLGMHHSTKILDTVGRYLEEEWRYLKKNPSPDTSVLDATWEDLPSNIHKAKVQVPQQNNAYDCGIFMLYYIERFIREAPERFTIDKLGMFSCSWFNPEDASDLRKRIRALLLEEFESARLDNVMSDGAASDGSSIEDSIKGGESEGDAPSDSSEMAVDFGNTGKSSEGIKVAASEEECGVSADAGKSNEGIKFAESEEASGESGDAGMSIEGIKFANSEEATGESGDAGKSIEGYVAESEEESGDSGDAWKSIEGINASEPVEASVEFGDAGKGIEVINVAESDEASVELGHAGKTKKGIKVAASEEACVECVLSTDKSMESVSDEEHTSSSRRGERTAGCALSESDSAKDEEGTMKADFDSSKTEKEGLIAIVSPERPRFNEGATRSRRAPIPDIVPDSDSDNETKMEVLRVYRRKSELINLE